MLTTYSINIQPDRAQITDDAIRLYLEKFCTADVEDALDEIFQMGVDAMLRRDSEDESHE